MPQLVTTEFAESGTRFTPDFFDSQVGKEVPFKIGDEQHGTCELLGVTVSEDGSFATMTFQVPDDVFDFAGGICVHTEERQ
jgi:hypothetical protein